jgi:hypothetical protein
MIDCCWESMSVCYLFFKTGEAITGRNLGLKAFRDPCRGGEC